MMRSIDKLRSCAEFAPRYSGVGEALRRSYDKTTTYYALEAACDAIEAELAERYMELPLDAEGTPTRFSQHIEHRGHTGEVWLIGRHEVMCSDRTCYPVGEYRHVRPDTWESIITDAVECGYNDGPMALADRVTVKELVERCEKLAGGAE